MSCLGVILRLAAAAAALVVLSLLALYLGAAWREEQVDRRWGQTRESLTQYGKRFTRLDANPSATKLVELSAAVGIDLSQEKALEKFKPSKTELAGLMAVRLPAEEHLKKQLERPDDAIQPLPDALLSYLASHEQAFDAIRGHLRSGDMLRWKQSGADIDFEIPNLLGILRLERMLLCAALERQRRGDEEGALDLLDGSWKLCVSLTERPELLSQVIAIAGANLVVGAVRKTKAPSSHWRERFARLPSRDSLLAGLEYETLIETQWAKRGAPLPGSPSEIRLLRPFWTPYARLSMAGHAENMRRVVEELKTADLCRYDPQMARQIWNRPFPRWNVLGRVAWPKEVYGHPWRLLYHLLQRELTLAVLEAKEAAASRGGQPASAIETESTTCPHEHWRSEISADGSITVSLSRRVSVWPKLGGVILPLEFCSATGGRAESTSARRSRQSR